MGDIMVVVAVLVSRAVSLGFMIYATVLCSHAQPDVPKLLRLFAWGLYLFLLSDALFRGK